jgi:hypothetical protein
MLLAHAGHWLIWVLYLLPVLAVLVAVLVSSLRARARPRVDGPDREPEV